MMTRPPSALLVIAHGSRDQDAVTEVLRQVELLRESLPDQQVVGSVLEFPSVRARSIQDAVDALVASGIERLVVLPLFLFDAGHVVVDVPSEMRQAKNRHVGLEIVILSPLSVADGLLDAVTDRVAEARTGLAGGGDTAVLLVGAGTSSQEPNAELFRVARLLWERKLASLVEVAFVSLTRPTIAEGLERCRALGAEHVVVAPYFLNTGVLRRRITEQTVPASRAAGIPATVASHIGAHPRMIAAVSARVRRALLDDAAVR
jgi:sirohydrochlorin cobaltochelatase